MSDPALLFAELGRYTSHFELRPVNPMPLMEMSNDPQITFLASISATLSGKFVFFQTKYGDTYVVGPYKKDLDRKSISRQGFSDLPQEHKWSVDLAYKSIFDRPLPMGPIWNVPVEGATSWSVELLVEATSRDDAERIAKGYLDVLTDQERQVFLIAPNETQTFHDLYSSEFQEGLEFKVGQGSIEEATGLYTHVTFENPCDS